jgi:heme O synthase-like polyprenyltransferase
MDTDNDLFVFILLVIVMVAIIQTSPDLQTGVLRLSVIVYGVMLYGTSCKTRIKKRKNAVGGAIGGAVGAATGGLTKKKDIDLGKPVWER